MRFAADSAAAAAFAAPSLVLVANASEKDLPALLPASAAGATTPFCISADTPLKLGTTSTNQEPTVVMRILSGSTGATGSPYEVPRNRPKYFNFTLGSIVARTRAIPIRTRHPDSREPCSRNAA